MEVSLLIPYRNRPEHLRTFLKWFKRVEAMTDQVEAILIETDAQPSLGSEQIGAYKNLIYHFDSNTGNFHKTRLLNVALNMASGKYALAYDIDLIPLDFEFKKHIEIADKSDDLLIAGYRINSKVREFREQDVDLVWKYMHVGSIADEDIEEGCLKSQFLYGERFGTLPFFKRSELLKIGGWDERFVGWGAEDQDMIGRYLGSTRFLLKSPDLLYLHLDHDEAEGWNDQKLTDENVKLYESIHLSEELRSYQKKKQPDANSGN